MTVIPESPTRESNRKEDTADGCVCKHEVTHLLAKVCSPLAGLRRDRAEIGQQSQVTN